MTMSTSAFEVVNLIDGVWTRRDGLSAAVARNPATGNVIGTVLMSAEQDVDLAVGAAQSAYVGWRKLTAAQRGEFLWKIADLLGAQKSMLAESITTEMGKVYAEALGEIDATIASCKHMAGEARRMFGQSVPSMMPDRNAVMVREPMGVVACISPWNFPIALAAYKIFAALITGNTVVWKPASEAAITAARFTDVMQLAGLPAGVVNLVLGSGRTVGNYLAQHQGVQVIAFTGSTEVGRQLAAAAGFALKRISLELGGKNAAIVLSDANLDEAAAAIVRAAFATTGQRCTAVSRVIVEASVKASLEERIVQRVSSLRIGNGLQPGIEVGPLVSARQLDVVQGYVEIAVEAGARVLAGGHALVHDDYASGFFYAPTVITDVQAHHRIAREEVFGPVLAILSARNLEDAIRINNDTEYGLAAAVFTNNLRWANVAAGELEAGMVFVNNGTITSESGMPFGGYKASGNGHREVSHHAFDVMTEWKTTYTSY